MGSRTSDRKGPFLGQTSCVLVEVKVEFDRRLLLRVFLSSSGDRETSSPASCAPAFESVADLLHPSWHTNTRSINCVRFEGLFQGSSIIMFAHNERHNVYSLVSVIVPRDLYVT